MKYRRQILLGLILVISPPLVTARWALRANQAVAEQVATLNAPLYPILRLSNDIALRTNQLKDHFITAAIAPNAENRQNCRRLADELQKQWLALLQHRSSEPVPELHAATLDYVELGLVLVESPQAADVFNRGDQLGRAAQVLNKGLFDFREEMKQEFRVNLERLEKVTSRARLTLVISTLVAFLMGSILVAFLVHRFGLKDDALRLANEELSTRFDELYRVNNHLEKQVDERKRAEKALRLSLNYEEALTEVSELFTATFSPNLQRTVEILGLVTGSDLAFLVMFKEGNSVEQSLVWVDENFGALSEAFSPDLSAYTDWFSALSRGENLVFSDIGKAPAFPAPIHQAGIGSLLAISITSEEKVFYGYMGFATVHRRKTWAKEDSRIMAIAAEILANYLSRKQTEDQLKHHAFHDGLTGLPNRSLFMDRLSHVLERSNRHPDQLFAVLFLDLDRFKPVNDSLGHLVGDQLLIQVSIRLQECVRGMDTVARLGGDEFIILLEEITHPALVEEIARRINERLADPFQLGKNTIHSSASIGVTLCHGNYTKAESMMRDADIAMYQAKTQGKSRYVVFDPSGNEKSGSSGNMESALRQAIDNKELELYFQPIVSFEKGTIDGFEGLLRWIRDGREFAPPGKFIPLAEEVGLYEPIGKWALEQACAQARKWLDAGFSDLKISLNCSPKQFTQRGFVQLIRSVLCATGLPASHLMVEVTEGLLMENVGKNISILHKLRDMNVHVGIDDFGTGFSSLSYLRRFPIHTLKIDRSFIRNIPHNPDDSAIASAIVAMATNLGLDIQAEGVENLAQFDFLKARGCQSFQGFLFSKALSAEEATQLLSKNKTMPIRRVRGRRSAGITAENRGKA